MKRVLLPFIVIVVIAGLFVLAGFLMGKIGKNGIDFSLPAVTEKAERSTQTVIKEVLPIGEYASLAYHYTSVVKDINAKDFKGWTIPFTTRKYIFTYDGIIKLGIDGTKILVEEPGIPDDNTAETGTAAAGSGKLPVIRIVLPPIKILSHEIMEDSIEVFEQSQTIFNEINIAEAFSVTAERKKDLEVKVMSGGAVKEAQSSVEHQFGALLRSLPGIRGEYDLEFVWQNAAPTANQAR